MKLVIGYTCYKEKEIELTAEQKALWQKYEMEWAKYELACEQADGCVTSEVFAKDPYGGDTENAIRQFAENRLFKDNADNIMEMTTIRNPATDEIIYCD